MADDPRFVVQHHLARADHYDFRLEIDGVLASWAVPKGPSLDPAEHRLAVRVGDHELDHLDYEGAAHGLKLVWDTGTFRNTSHHKQQPLTAAEGLARGRLSFWLEGVKLRGAYSLIRTRGYGPNEDSWLLTKKKDEAADRRSNPVETRPESVLTGRTLEQIAADE